MEMVRLHMSKWEARSMPGTNSHFQVMSQGPRYSQLQFGSLRRLKNLFCSSMITLWSMVEHFSKSQRVGRAKFHLDSVFDSWVFMKWEEFWFFFFLSYEFLSLFLPAPHHSLGNYFGKSVCSLFFYSSLRYSLNNHKKALKKPWMKKHMQPTFT